MRSSGTRRTSPAAALTGTLLATLVLAAPAGAASVTLSSRIVGSAGPEATITTVSVTAPAGEANAVTASVSGGKLVLVDPATTLTAGAGCTQAAQRTVECPLPDELDATLGDGNDSFDAGTIRGPVAELSGGSGNDTLTAGFQNDTLSGGGGLDTLKGGFGNDTLADDDGGAPDADVLDGGGGNDGVSFLDHVTGITLNLRAGTSGDGDSVISLETVRLGEGADVVVGSDDGDFITGGSGDNRIDGGAGDDFMDGDGELRGGAGADNLGCHSALGCRLFGGIGNDHLTGGNGKDLLDGGAGDDELVGIRGADVLRGGSGNDELYGDTIGGAGTGHRADTLRGGPGRDQLDGGGGRDDMAAGTGADTVFAGDGRRDKINCGAGRDRLVRDRRDPKPRSCERVQVRT